MRKKSNLGLWILIIVIVVAAIFYSQKTTDEVSALLAGVQNNLEIVTTEPAQKSFKWSFKEYEEVGQVEVAGQQLKLSGITNEDYEKIEEYFENQGFIQDSYNAADGTTAWQVGYKNDQTVCTLCAKMTDVPEPEAGQTMQEQETVAETTEEQTLDVEVNCGQTEDEIEHLFTKFELIQQLFAKKYGKKMSAVNLTIQKETNTHVRGIVSFHDEEKAVGIFLAAMVDGEWQLAYDGSGAISCAEMQAYNFPDSMLEGCAEQDEDSGTEDTPEHEVN